MILLCSCPHLISQGRSRLQSLSLGKLGCACLLAHQDCPLPPLLLGQAANHLTKLTLEHLTYNCSLTRLQLETFLQAIQQDTKLKELLLSSVPSLTDVNPAILTSAFRKIEKITLSTINLNLEQAQTLFLEIEKGTSAIKELCIYHLANNPHDQVKNVESSILAGAVNQLEKADFLNVNLNSQQVTAVLTRSLRGTRLHQLKLDRFDPDRSHLFLPASLMDNITFNFDFSQ